MKEMIEDLNSKLDVQNIGSKEEAERALDQISVGLWRIKVFVFL